jgi:trehalose/maltose hydrolase-like predicted phosphorylase
MSTKQKKIDSIFPIKDWEVIEEDFSVENNYRTETIFALGNGFIGMRGNFEEGYSGPTGTGLEGTYINGFYESETIKYPEIAYGFAEKSQTMLNVTNSKIIRLYIDNEEFNILKGSVESYSRVLDMKNGLLKRSLIWCSSTGRKVKIDIQRLVSFNCKNLAVINYEVTPINFSGKVELISMIDGNVSNLTAENDPRVGSGLHGRVLSVLEKQLNGGSGLVVQKTKKSRLSIACAMENEITTQCSYKIENKSEDLFIEVKYIFDGEKDKKITLTKFISYVTAQDKTEEEIGEYALNIVSVSKAQGFEKIKNEQIEFLNEYWFKTDVKIQGDPAIQQGIRLNMFHLLQSVGRDGKTNIGAKGLTGEGYEGHYFWDTETFMLPFFLYNNPSISRKLLEYRYLILDKARERARQLDHEKGALFPWRTIDGDECSSYYPAGTAQYHINGDISFAIKRYMDATGDNDFLILYGAEILFETARVWADLGNFIPRKGNKFCINGVTGPDEYNAVVNNNCYTNMMARENLEYAYEIAVRIEKENCEAFNKIVKKIALEKTEIEFWKKAAQNMYIPYDEQLKIHLQDDAFLDRAPWDFKNVPADKYPLLLHFHPLVIYRHQVCKQADLVLALFLLNNRFSLEEKKRNYDYYEKCTTHDSSLSTCIFSIVASEIGYQEAAYQYFMLTARMDLDDYHGNTKDGIHAANMAGTWMCMVNGFAGMRVYSDTLSFHPYIPEGWESYSFNIAYRGRLIKVTVSKEGASYELLQGNSLTILHKGGPIDLNCTIKSEKYTEKQELIISY